MSIRTGYIHLSDGGLTFGCALIAMTVLMAPLEIAHANGRTIVGTWAPDPRQCTPAEGMIAIQPLAMVGDEFRCDFRDVSRSGDVVTWHGSCGFPENASASKVVATLRSDALFVDMNGQINGPFKRCQMKD